MIGLDLVGGILKPISEIIDNVSTTDEERLKLRNELAKIQADLQGHIVAVESKRLEMEGKIREAEANSSYWLTASWRPICSILFVLIITFAAFGLATPDPKILDFMGYFVIGYGGSRGIEKITENIRNIGK